MERILLIGIVLSSLLGAGAVGTMMTDYDIGMWSSNQGIIGIGGCPMMNEVKHMGLTSGPNTLFRTIFKS